MGFFDDDDFGIEDLFRSFANGEGFSEYQTIGPDGKKRTVRTSSRNLKGVPAKQVVTSKEVFFIFDFSGEKNVAAEIKDELVSNEYDEKVHSGKKLMLLTSSKKNLGMFVLPKKLKLDTLEFTFHNGILEVKFRR